ncbi:MAG TPA: hypothetical protein VGG72_05440 [Bryobacteraceae bacterium]|jgi:hypothetical protein
MGQETVSDGAYFLSYDSDSNIRLAEFSALAKSLGALPCGSGKWILRTHVTNVGTWNNLRPFWNNGGTLFLIQIFPGSLAYSLPESLTHDPLKILLEGLEPYTGKK